MTKLKIKVLDEALVPLYQKRVNIDGDAGVDLYFPDEVIIPGKSLGVKVDLKIQAEMVQEVNNQLTQNIPKEMLSGMFDISDKYLSYIVSPRSSIIKTPLRMSNSIGVMDSGYRGNFIVPIDNLSDEDFVIEKHTRLFQVTGPTLEPIELNIVNRLTDSQRGSGGFGSTGN
tara:strand:- start:708 stop:1220 length:513 start_codon:yes stop_codon:yes gene_type:complete